MMRIRFERLLLAVTGVLVLSGSCIAGEKKDKVSLAEFLKRLGWEQVRLEGDQNRLSLRQYFAVATMKEGSHKFLVDTGCGMTRVDMKLARQFKTLGELGGKLEDSALGKVTDTNLVILDKLALGRAQFLNQPAAALNLSMDYIAVGFDGILGDDFFIRNHCLIDCGNWSLFVRAERPSEEVTRALRAVLVQSGCVSAPLRVHGALVVAGKANSEPVAWIVDTGAASTALDEAIAMRLNLPMVKGDPGSPFKIRQDLTLREVGIGAIGAHNSHVTVLKDLSVGAHTWPNFSVCVTPLKYWAPKGADGQEVPQGFLGRDFLHSNTALIDCSEHTLWLAPN